MSKTLREAVGDKEIITLEGLRRSASVMKEGFDGLEPENEQEEIAHRVGLFFLDLMLFAAEKLDSIEISLRTLAEEAADASEVG